jgi:hypothetical protein
MTSDPGAHREMEMRLAEHVSRLLADDRFRVDTIRGRRPVATFQLNVQRFDRADQVKRTMSEMGKPDRELLNRMPVGLGMDVLLFKRKWGIFKQKAGRVKMICASPTKPLLNDAAGAPLSGSDVQRLISESGPADVPTTVVLLSTSGFTIEAHEIAERRAGRSVFLVEPGTAGGWKVYGPQETRDLIELLDPEADDAKRARVRALVESNEIELSGSGVAADRLAAQAELPVQLVESELKHYAKASAGLVAKRLEGRIVLFREGSAPVQGAASMAFTDRITDRILTLFGHKGETEKKIAFLAERRALLGQQRDRAYDELTSLEGKESTLRADFMKAAGETSKRRITSQMVQMRREIARRQQLVDVLNRQVEVVGTHQHTLELVRQGGSASQLANPEEMAKDAAAAEEVLAQLQANSELADSLITPVSSMNAEEQALYEELEAEAGRGKDAEAPAAPTRSAQGSAPASSPVRETPRRTEPEAS